MKENYVYKDSNGEYFSSELKEGSIVLKNPSYPFAFTLSALGELEEVGPIKEFGHLIQKKRLSVS